MHFERGVLQCNEVHYGRSAFSEDTMTSSEENRTLVGEMMGRSKAENPNESHTVFRINFFSSADPLNVQSACVSVTHDFFLISILQIIPRTFPCIKVHER